MAAPGSYSGYKTNVGRSVTKKWKDANQINYDGDDWGDDDDDGYDDHPAPPPVSGDDSRRPTWDRQSNRSFTNPIPPSHAPPPAPSQIYNRPSFDRGDEQRSFSSGAAFNSAYPSSQRDPFPEPQHDYDMPAPAYRDQPPLRLNTQGPPPSNAFRPGSRGRQYPSSQDPPLSAPGIFSQQQRRSGSSGRPPPSEIFQRYDSPMRPDSRGSNASARQFPPRKASLGPQSPDLNRPGNDIVMPSPPAATSPSVDDRPIPAFVRPSDIYKRIPEEIEKVRQSQDSSRPSMDSTTLRPQPDPLDSKPGISESRDAPIEDSESARRLRSTLDPVPERKSEYGLDNLLNPSSTNPAPPTADSPTETTEAGVARHPTNASSVYTDRPDPVSASTISRNQSMHEGILEEPSVSRLSYGLPAIGRMSSFGMDLGSSDLSGPSSTRHVPPSPAQAPPPPPVPQKDESIVDQSAGGLRAQPLQHQSSLGYRSMVQQAFDDSQKDAAFSPTSTTNSVFRSNSASTSDISPIISHKPHALATSSAAQSTHPAVLEEPSQTDSRRNTTETLRAEPASLSPNYGVTQHSNLAESTNVDSPVRPEQESASLVDNAVAVPPNGDMLSNETPVPAASGEKALQSVPAPLGETAPSTERTTSEEWKEWQTQRKQFNATAGIQDSGPTTPHVPSPIPHSESPPKGTGRDLADQLESNPGRTSPGNLNIATPAPGVTIAEPTRPTPQLRNESFRPILPGGWQSYASTAPSETQQISEPSIRPSPLAAHRSETTESIPTAKAPARGANDGITTTAFAAAATAGTALASAFMGHQDPEHKAVPSPTRSEVSSENEWDQSSSEDEDEQPPLSGNEASHGQVISPGHVGPAIGPTSTERTISAAPVPSSLAATSESSRSRSDSIEYPAPLRTSRILESSPISRPPIPNVALSTTSTQEDNDKLQHDIVNSLTPKSSNIDGGSFSAGHIVPQVVRSNDSASWPTNVTQTPSQVNTIDQTARTPSSAHSLATVTSPLQNPSSAQGVPSAQRPHLQQRFSWETSSDKTPSTATPKQLSPVPTNSPDTIREGIHPMSSLSGLAVRGGPSDPNLDQQSTPSARPPIPGGLSQNPQRQSSGPQPPFPQPESVRNQPSITTIQPTGASLQSQRQSGGSQQAAGQMQTTNQSQYPQPDPAQVQSFSGSYPQQSQQHQTASTSAATGVPPSTGPSKAKTNDFAEPPHHNQQVTTDPMSFRSILALGTPHERILAFNESRQAHAESDGQLEGWLSSLNTSEHSDVFALNGRVSNDTSELTSAHKPSPRRTLTESVGSRHIQEDGKKLMAKAGRFGGKAGIAAKGLFAKGKERMRTASSGEKGRRKSTGLSSTDSNEVLPDPQSQPRDPTFLEGPPQIPFTLSPATPLESSDWFANSILDRSKPQPADDTTSSRVSVTQDTPHRGQQQHAGLSGDASKSTTTPASPAISALADDDHDEQAALPSRSVSQLTRPTADESPAGSPHRVTAEREVESENSPLVSQRNSHTSNDSAAPNLNTPGPLLGHAHGSDVFSSDRSLQVPDGRRRSIISDVSSASPSPIADPGNQIRRRSVSPTDDVAESQKTAGGGNQSQPGQISTSADDNQLPGYDQVVSEPVDLLPEKSALEDPPPRIDDPYERRDVDTVPAVSLSDPVQHLMSQQSGNNYRTSNDEPSLSMTTGDVVGPSRHLQDPDPEDLGQASPTPLSPVSQTLSKEMSQVSVGEVFDQSNAVGQRQSRSYLRPFGADPNVRNHPAFKTSEPEQPNIDRAQMYSSESPLPSARRHLEEPDRSQQQRGSEQFLTNPSVQEQPPVPGAYRIPGPYIQNYRSPKQITTPRVGRSETQVEASGHPLPSALRSQQQQHQQQQQEQEQEYQQQQQQQYQNQQHLQSQQDQHYQQYQQQQQPPQPQAQNQRSSQTPAVQDPVRPPFIPDQHHAQPDQQRYGGPVPEHARQHSYGSDFASNRISQQPDQFPQRQQQSMGPPPAPTPAITAATPPAGRKKSTFGSFFGGSGSRSKLKKQERAPAPVSVAQNHDGQQKDKRASIFRRNSRHDSISSQQSGQYHTHDQVGHLPPSNMPAHSARRQSRDIFRTSSNEAKEQPIEKKKRFSGFGNKLFKSGSTAKAPAASQSASRQAGTIQEQYPAQNYLSPQNTYDQYSGDAWTTQQQQPPTQFERGFSDSSQQQQAPTQFQSGFPNSSQQQQQPPQPGYPHAPQREFSQPQRAYTYGSQPGRPESHEYSTAPGSQQDNQYPTATSPFQYTSGIAGGAPGSVHQAQSAVSPQPANSFPYLNPDQRRPSDLRIDTSTPNRSSHNVPATAPAQVYPNRGSSFSPPPPSAAVPRAYGSTSPAFPTTTAPALAATSTAKPVVGRDHVIDLHKRSRSPKLGRKHSSEDLDARRRREQDGGLAATGLGTFVSKRISPVGGVPRLDSDQERPYAIGLPGLDEDAGQSKSAGDQRVRTMSPVPPSAQQNRTDDGLAAGRSGTPVSLDDSAKGADTGTYSRATHLGATDGLVSRSGTSAAQHQQPTGKAIARDISAGSDAAELQGSHPPGYESEEEVIMSATAYPGQEWMPTFVGDGRWDD